MEKKFDFKTIAIACLLFFGFVFLLFYKFSSADDSINHYTSAIDIFTSQQSFDDFKSTLPNKILPEWYTEEESMINLLDSIACFAMGDYLQVGFNIVSELSGQITGDPLFLEHFVFDYDSLCWVFDSDTDDFIKSKLDPHIYVTPSGGDIGNWRPLPVYDIYFSPWPSIANQFVNIEGNSCYIASAPNSYIIAYKGSQVSGSNVRRDGVGGYQYYTCNEFYQGSLDSGYYVSTYGYGVVSGLTPYSDVSTALSDFFGNDASGDPYLIDGVSIRNDDFIVKPLSYPASVLVDYPNEITYPDYDPDDTRLTFEYTYNMEVPFWLKNPTTEPTSYELPTDYDFGNIEYEYEADSSYLAGAGIVQDVFDILPASLQGLIALFGAGSLAFIFLRR